MSPLGSFHLPEDQCHCPPRDSLVSVQVERIISQSQGVWELAPGSVLSSEKKRQSLVKVSNPDSKGFMW